MKSQEEIKKRLRDLVHKHRKAYIREHLDYNPSKCALIGLGLHSDCSGCTPARGCRNRSKFDLIDGVDEIVAQFEKEIKDPMIMVRKYREIALLLWVLGSFDMKQGSEVPELGEQRTGNHETPTPESKTVPDLYVPSSPEMYKILSTPGGKFSFGGGAQFTSATPTDGIHKFNRLRSFFKWH